MPTITEVSKRMLPRTQTNGNVVYTTIDEVRSKSGVNLSNYRERIRRGVNATTAFAASQTVVKTASPGNWRCVTMGFWPNGNPKEPNEGKISGHWFTKNTIADPDSYNTQQLVNNALSGFASKVRGAQTSFNGGVFMGELAETVRMMKSPARALRRGLDNYLLTLEKRKRTVSGISARARGNRRVAHRHVNNMIQDTWLEASFGWIPLLNDIDDAAKAASEIITYKAPIKVVQEEAQSEFQGQSDQNMGPFSLGTGTVSGSSSTGVELSVRYKGGVKCNVDGSPSIPQTLGLNLGSFLPTVWELVPYSFLVDYFSNVGDIVNSLSVTRADLSWVCRTDRKVATLTCTSRDIIPGLSGGTKVLIDNTGSPSTFVLEKKSITRSSPAGSFTPGLTFTVPGAGSGKWINMAALGIRARSVTKSYLNMLPR